MVGGEATKPVVGTASAFVVQADEGAFLVWNALGDLAIARTPEELGRHVLEALRNPKVPRVEAGPSMGKTVATLSRMLETMAGPEQGGEPPTAVHIVVYLAADDGEVLDAAVWPPKGPPRVALGVEVLGRRLAELAVDDGQPRCPAGRPPDPGAELWDRGLSVAARLVPGLFASEG